jgi:phosphohistidine phosphatase
MKTLLLLRHAKSSWDDPTLADHDRPLKKRGVKAALRMGQVIRDFRLNPELILCSTAVRAKETLKLVLETARISPAIEYLDELFHCPVTGFGDALRRVDNRIHRVMLIGHNPGLEEFLHGLTQQETLMPTAALARVKLDLSEWQKFESSIHGQLDHIWRPRELKDEQD